MRGERFGLSGSPVIVTTFHRARSVVHARYKGPVVCVGLPAWTTFVSRPLESTASAVAITAWGMPPDSSSTARA